MKIELEACRSWHPGNQYGGDLRLTIITGHAPIPYRRRRWVRVGVYFDTVVGSHTGFWRTRCDDLRGWNYRIGRTSNCLTLLAHARGWMSE